MRHHETRGHVVPIRHLQPRRDPRIDGFCQGRNALGSQGPAATAGTLRGVCLAIKGINSGFC